MAIQRARTLKVADAFQATTDKVFKVIHEDDPRLEGLDLSRWAIGFDYPIAIPLSVAAQYSHYAIDLGVHLLINETGEEFITSDNPVVAHNRYCEGVTYRGVLGWNCAGIQILLPISPRLIVLLYDTKVYAVGAARKQATTTVSAVSEVRRINAFQILNANNNIYFRNDAMEHHLNQQASALKKKREMKRNVIIQTERVAVGNGTREIIGEYERIMPLDLDLACIRIKRSMKRIPLHTRAAMYRREEANESDTQSGAVGSRVYRLRRSFTV